MNNGWHLVVGVTPKQLEVVQKKLEPLVRTILEEEHLTPRVDDFGIPGQPRLSITFSTE